MADASQQPDDSTGFPRCRSPRREQHGLLRSRNWRNPSRLNASSGNKSFSCMVSNGMKQAAEGRGARSAAGADHPPLIQEIVLRNVLSIRPGTEPVALNALNVL